MSRDERDLNASLAQSLTNRYNNSQERIIRKTLMSLAYLSNQNDDNPRGRKLTGYMEQGRLQSGLQFRGNHDKPPKRI
jgi:hypothetical protein